LLDSLANESNQPIVNAIILPEVESQQLLRLGLGPEIKLSLSQSIVSLFEQQVLQNPNSTALVFENLNLSYKQLNELSNQVANLLISKGVKPNASVPFYLNRGHQMIIAMLGIMKSGAAYLPLDSEFEDNRIDYVLKDCATGILLSEKSLVRDFKGIEVVSIDSDLVLNQSTANPEVKIESSDLAYVIYTSGSTGFPKGVMIEHANVLDYFFGLNSNTDLSLCASHALVSSIATDLGNTGIFGSLLNGATLHVFSGESVSNSFFMLNYFAKHTIDCLKIVPSHWQALCEDYNLLLPNKLLIFGGELLSGTLVNSIRKSGYLAQVINHYGPTETTIGKLLYITEPDRLYEGNIPIGRPFSNTSVYVLSNQRQLSPLGVSGELFIGGNGLSRGYLNNTELTDSRFVHNPFSKETSLIYSTGDLVKWLSDGNIEYLGRLDDQLKIRGFRIEPGEIESAIAESKLTKQSVVIASADQSGSKRLIAFVVVNKMYQKQELMNYLRSKLPDYMIPSVIMELTSIPLTANGKVDKRALPEVEHNQSNQYIAPSNEMQRQLCVIWQELLELKQVGITDNFFELGGHSLLAMRVISLVRRQLGIELRVKDLFKYPSIAELSKQLSRQKHGILLPSIDKQERPAHIPLSFSQERLWFIDQLEGSIQYHIPAVLELKGKLNIEALNFGFKEIINRHEILRTSIVQHQGQAYQQIHASLEWQIEQIKDYKTQTQEELESSIKALINQPYDLSKDSMLRAYLIERTDQDHILVVTLHHIVSDGWSTSIIVNELAELYRSFEQKVPVLLKTLQIQYADYAIWQRNYIQGELLDTKLAYWKQKLQNASPLELPTDYARPAVQGVRGLTEEFEIEASLTQQIKQLSQNSNTTVFMTLLSAFKVMLYRYTNQQDITVGTPIAGRQQLETESLIGYFVNTLALRSDLSSQTKFSELLAQVRTTTLEAYEHQEIPFEKVVEAVVKERDLSRSPLFQVMFVMNNTPEVTGIKLGDVETTEYRFKNDMTQFDLSMTITQINGKMDASIEYCTDLYKTGSIRRMVQHYLELLKSIVQNPDKEVGGLRMLSYTEQNQILREFNTTATAYPQDKLVTELFETQAAASPQKIALSFENEQISYQELNAKSNQLAHYLRQRGAKAEMLIPICLERGPKMIIGILGILKSGAAYVPIDSDYPQSRISYILNDTEARLVVSDQQTRAKIIGRQTEIIDIESDWSEIAKQPKTNLERTAGLNNLAYLIYTSGSTGEPKGVMIEHKSLLNYVLFFKEYLEINSQDGITQQNSIAFDTSIEEIFPTLVSGATLYIMKEGGRDLDKIKKKIESGKVTIVTTTPLFIDALNKDIDKTGNLRHVVSGGDVLRPSAIDKLITQVNIVNGYGPSETTIAVVFKRVLNLADAAQIGKPIPNVKIYILDDSLNPLPIGVYGEICISGVQVARGYFNNPEITSTKFVVDPFDEQKTERIYKTGDIGRWLEDGNIEFYGRKDEQVKIRGFRIELGEIESVLNLSPMVEHGAVLAVELPNGSKRLVAYIVPNSTFNKDKLITDLQQTLPEFMVPATWIMLDSIPLNSNGKIDRKALPEPDMSLQINENYSAPQTSTEKVMAKIWQELLGIEQIGVHDNFFESGGDSILTIQVVSRARRAGFNINTRDLFTYQSIHKLCEAISNRTRLESKEEDEKVFGTSGLLPIQTWFLEKPHKNPSHYNQSVFLKIDKRITPESLEQAVRSILAYHDALRFNYVKKTTNWVQEYQEVQGQLFVEDFSKVSKKNFANTLLEITDKYQKSLNIEQGDLVKFVWIKTPKQEAENRLFICIHHLVVDGVSWRILLEDFEILLNQIQNNEPLNLGQKSSSFKHWFESLKQYSESENLNLQRSFWSKTVEGYVSLSLDTGYDGPVYTKDIFTISVQLDSIYTRQLLQEISKVYSTEINDILLAALALTFNKKYKYPKIVIGLEGHGREEFPDSPDTSRTVGWFTTLFPICLEIAPNQSPDYYIKSVKEQLRKVPAKGLGYGILKSIVQADELKGRDPWDIVFNYLGQFDNAVSNSRWFKASTEQVAADIDDHFEIIEKVSINSYVQDNVLTINWNASNLHFKNETIQKLANDFIDNLKLLIDECTINKQKQFKSPSDFGLGDDIEFVEFDEFLSEPCQDKTRGECVSGVYRLSGMQQGMLFHSLYDEKSDAYIEQFICDIFNVESELFEKSWKQVIGTHSALRTGFFNNSFTIPVQCIFKDVNLPIKWLDLLKS
jgi:amino acid adenylation domain-containing protein/non-ribosomal peptide synthase protein (TIGR01720 family)